MKLEPEIIAHIRKAVKTAHMLGIEDVCIDDGLVRAMHADRSVLIIAPNDIDLPFDSMGITRIPQFLSRLDIVSNSDKFTIDFSATDDVVKSVVMKCTGTKIDFKCGDPNKIIAPRKNNDVVSYGIAITDESIELLKKSEAAMKADEITIISNDDGVSFELNDVNNDIFRHELQIKAEILSGDSLAFAFRYPAKLLISLLRNNVNYFEVAERGSLKLQINGFDIFVFPKV